MATIGVGGTYTLPDPSAALLTPDAAKAANQVYASGATPTDQRNAVNDLFGAQEQATALQTNAAATAATDTAQAQAEQLTATGDQQEAQLYLQAAGVADSNARLARISGDIQYAQDQREWYKTISGMQADVAGAGFAQDSTSMSFMHADSKQQASLQEGVAKTQAEIQAGAYLQQEMAAEAEAQAGTTAANQATVLGQAAQDAATTVQTNAASQGAMLNAAALNNAMSLLNLDGGVLGGGTLGNIARGGPGALTPGAVSYGPANLPGANPALDNQPVGQNLMGQNTVHTAGIGFGPYSTIGGMSGKSMGSITTANSAA